MNGLFNMLKSERKAVAKFGAKVRDLIHAGTDEGKGEVVGCAEAIEAAFPVAKVDGKDENRDERNDFLRSLRMALMRAGRALPEPVKLTIKKIDGTWTLVSEGEAKDDPEAAESEGAGSEGDTEQSDDALWDAVELVLANLDKPAILGAIRSGLDKLAKSASK